jgi:outer membrane protein, heavy metal efflux system
MKCTFVFRALLLTALWTAFTGYLWAQQAPPLTLQQAVSTYIDKNLEIQAARYRVERSRADQLAAQMRLNPGLNVMMENLKFSGPTPAGKLYEIGVSYAETIELGGKRELRQRVADANVTVAEAQFEETMRRGVAEVERMYMQALLARYDVTVARENRDTFQQLVQFNLARFQQGAIPEGDLIKVRLERVKFDSTVRQAELALRQATIRLMDRIGETSFPQQEIAGELNYDERTPDLEPLKQEALTERPDIRAAQNELNALKEQLALEQARSRTDLIPFVGYKRVGNDNTVMAGISVPLKVRDRNQAGIARAEADVKAAEARLTLARNHAIAEVTVAYEAFQSAKDQVRTFRSQLLNQTDESSAIALAAYREGATELLPVLEAERTRAEIRQQYFKTLFDYQASIIELELAVGKEIRP